MAGTVLVLLTVVSLAPALKGSFIWDDDAYVSANATLRSAGGLRRIWFEPGALAQYYPLTYTTFWIEYRLWGLNPTGYHTVNIILHVLNALLLWRVLHRLQVPGAWVAAMIFAVHPVQVESVAWVTERKNVLSALFCFLALHTYLNARPLNIPGSNRVHWMWYGASLAAFACAMLSKTVACSLPAVFLLLIWWKQGRIARLDVRLLTPFFVLGCALALPSLWLEHHHVGTADIDFRLSPIERILLAGRALWFYAEKLVWPHPLIFSYPRWQIDPHAWSQRCFPALAVAGAFVLFLARRSLGRGPLVALLFFGGTLVPALGFVDVYLMRYSYVADHFQYLASVGLIVLATGGVGTVLQARTRHWSAILVGGAMPLIAILATLTWRQAHIYADRETLWRDTVRKNPASWIAHNNLGSALLEAGHTDEAMRHFESARQIKQNAVTDMGIALCLAAQGRSQEAMAQLRVVLEHTPDDARAFFNLGAVAAQSSDLAQAAEAYQSAVRLKPDYLEARKRLGDALLSLQRPDDAAKEYMTVLRFDPRAADVYDRLGVALTMQRRFDDAIHAFDTAVQLKPDLADAYSHWGAALSMQGRRDEAIKQYREALRYNPNNPDALYNLRVAQGEGEGTAPAPQTLGR